MRAHQKREVIFICAQCKAQRVENRMSAHGDEINTGDGCDQRERMSI